MANADARLGWLSGWLRARHWKRQARHFEALARELDQRLEVERERNQQREEHLLNRVLQGVKLAALPHIKPQPVVEAKPAKQAEPELTVEELAARDFYRQQAREANLPMSQADEWFERFKQGDSYTEQ